MKISHRNLIIAFGFFVMSAWHVSFAAAQEKLLVFTPASMTDVMGALAKSYEKISGSTVNLSIGGTAQLARQIDNGAPAQVFISADAMWVDWLKDRKRIAEESIKVVAGNDLVIAVRNETENWADHKALLTSARFAMAEPQSIPAGRYARQALTKLGIWEQAQSQAIYGENVRVTLRQLALGEVGAAVVYATDVAVEPTVRTAWTFPADSYEKVQYFAAVVDGASSGGDKFVEFLLSKQAQYILKKAGFKTAVEAR